MASGSLVCHLSPVGGIDDKIANVLNGLSDTQKTYSKEDISIWRSLYDMDHKEPLVTPIVAQAPSMDDTLNAVNELSKYINDKAERQLKQLKDTTNHMARTFAQLYEIPGWDYEVRRNRINMVAHEFSRIVSQRVEKARLNGVSLTREQVVNGYKSNGHFYDGQASVFDEVFDFFHSELSKALKVKEIAQGLNIDDLSLADQDILNQALHRVEEIPKLLQNWSAVCAFARIALRNTEGLKLGQTLEYASPTTPDNFSLNAPIQNLYDLEESVREAWQSHYDEISTFASMGAEVRRFFSTIPDVDWSGNDIKDDFGYPVMMDPVATTGRLLELLRGCTTESDLIRRLHGSEGKKEKKIFKYLAKAIGADLSIPFGPNNNPSYPALLTQLLHDMHKNLVPFTAMLKSSKFGIYIKKLNERKNYLEDEFILRVTQHARLTNAAVYDGNGKIDWVNLAKWNAHIDDMLPSNNSSSGNIFSGLRKYNDANAEGVWKLERQKRIEFIKEAAEALGIRVDNPEDIYNNSSHVNAFFDAVRKFRNETRNAWDGTVISKSLETIEKYKGVMPENTEQKQEFESALDDLNKLNLTYEAFRLKAYGRNSNDSSGAGNEAISKMLKVVKDATESYKMERYADWYDRHGKHTKRYSDLTPSYMGDLVDKIHKFVERRDANGLRAFIMDRWGKSSFFYDKSSGKFLNRWLQELYDSITVDTQGNIHIDKNALAKVFAFDEFLGSNIDKSVTIFEDFTEKSHGLAMIKQFVQSLDQTKGSSRLVKYPCFILGDSGKQRFFTAKKYYKTARDIPKNHSDNGFNILQGLTDVFQQELERMKYVNAVNASLDAKGYSRIENFSETGNEFTMLKFLNPDFAEGKYWKILTGNDSMTFAEIKNLGNEAMRQAKLVSTNSDTLSKAIEEYMKDSLATFKEKLVSIGLLEKRVDGEKVTYIDAEGNFSRNLQWYKDGIDGLLEDFFWNTKYATIEQLQLFTVDPAFYDHRYPIKDLQKRYKEIYAPGKGVSIDAWDQYNVRPYASRDYEKAVYFNDLAVSSKDVNPYFFEVMQKTFGEDSPFVKEGKGYTDNTLTDGQGYRSLKSYRTVKGMAGEWSPQMEEAYKRIEAIRHSGSPLTEADIKQIADLAVYFQPIKPYLYTLEKYQLNTQGDTALIPVQHKYAEIVLIPELMNDGALKDIALWMEENGVDLVASTKCVKVGAFGSAELKGCDTTMKVWDALSKSAVHELPWSDYRIQSGVPQHLNHDQLFGTQSRKIILTGINKGKTYNYLDKIFGKEGTKVFIPGLGEQNLTGSNLISFYNSLMMANLFDSYSLFSENTDSNKKLSDRFIQSITANSRQSEDSAYGFSLIEDGPFKGQFAVPLGEPGMEHDAVSFILSELRNCINKQRILGGSAVQASPFGLSSEALGIGGERAQEVGDLFEVVSLDGNNILYDEIEMPWNRTITNAYGQKVPLKFEDWCNPDGTLKMSDQIVYGKDAEEYLSWPVSGRDQFGRAKDPSQGYYIPLIETRYKGILDIIAYRIPTEMEYSMLNCKVFRFTPPLVGGVLKVPSSRTTTAGFDFDIDKLYFFMKEFAQSHLTKSQIEDVWANIYELKYDEEGNVVGGNEIYQALVKARELDQTGIGLLGGFSDEFSKSKDYREIAETSEKTKVAKLHNYWESAGLEGTDTEAFTKYLIDHNYAEYDVYDPTVSPLNPELDKDGNVVTKGNSRAARNNMLIDIFRSRLIDEETLKARYTPGGFANNRDAALRMRILQYADHKDITDASGNIDWNAVNKYVNDIDKGIKKDPEPEYDVSDPTAILVYNQQNQIASKLIGIFANQNTNHIYSSTLQEFRLRNSIRFGNHVDDYGLNDFLVHPEGVDVDTNVAEYLAASVDAVKDPVLNFLNLNLITADAAAMLARIGYTPMEIGLLFTQPIIKDLCTYAANEGVSTNIAMKEMLDKYGNSNTSLDKILIDYNNVSTDVLANNIIQGREGDMSASFKNRQLQVLKLFNDIMGASDDLSSFIQATRYTASNSIGSTAGDQIALELRMKAFMDKYSKEYTDSEQDPRKLKFKLSDNYKDSKGLQSILDFNETLIDLSADEYLAHMASNPLAFEQCMMDITRKTITKVFKKHMPYYTNNYNNMRSLMQGLSRFNNLNADAINSLHREFIVFLLSSNLGSKFDGEAPSEYSDYANNREFYTKEFPLLIRDIQNSLDPTTLNSEALTFLLQLNVMGDFENTAFEYEKKQPQERENIHFRLKLQDIGGMQSYTADKYTQMWASAFNSNESFQFKGKTIRIKDLAEHCYFYNYYTLGYNFHPNVFMNLAPTLLKMGLRIEDGQGNSIGYLDFINKVIHGGSDVAMDSSNLTLFAKQYILNHLDNKSFVFTPTGKTARTVKGLAYKEGRWLDTFTISKSNFDDTSFRFFTVQDPTLSKFETAFVPVIAVKEGNSTAYYMANSGSENFNVVDSANGSIRYVRVNALGNKGDSIKYFKSNAYKEYQRSKSIFDDAGSKEQGMEQQQRPDNSDSEAESSNFSGKLDGNSIQVGQDISEMFTDSEWAEMLETAKGMKYSFLAESGLKNFKEMLEDTSKELSVNILNDILKEIGDKYEKGKLKDDTGEIVCH